MSYTFHTTGNMSFQWELDRKQKNKKQKNKQMHEWNPIIMEKMNAMNSWKTIGALIHYNTHPLDCRIMQCSQQNLHTD